MNQGFSKRNKQLVDKALEEILTPALEAFIKRKMREVHGERWLQVANRCLKPYHIENGEPKWFDPEAVLYILLYQWNTFCEPQKFDHFEKSLVTQLIDARHQWAHKNTSKFTNEYTFRTLDNMECLLAGILDKLAAQEVHKLKEDFRQQWHEDNLVNNKPEVISNQSGSGASHSSLYPEEFEALIKEKVRNFCGRRFVFTAFQEFIKNNSKGYFTIVGDAGIGKSAIAAKYVVENKCPCYFNILVDGRNRPDLFLKSIRQQLIHRYNLQDCSDADLLSLIAKVSQKIPSGESLIIVIDALDEVDQEAGAENILFLPKTLPDHVYFLLTRRPYEYSKKRLYTEGVPMEELNLSSEYVELSKEDVKEYIRLFVNEDNEYKHALNKWIEDCNITAEEFVEQLAVKSENSFMYLRYILPSIARGFYNDLSLKQLPDGLQAYYQTHWLRMGMDDKPQELMVIILFILVEIGTPIPCEMIAPIADRDEVEVEKVLQEWYEYLKPQTIEGELCYSIYHASFLDFLKSKREMKSTRKLFQEVKQRIADYLY